MHQVLIVAASPILRIVIARTLERIYLKPIPATPQDASKALADHKPGMVIVDAMTEDAFLSPLLSQISTFRESSDGKLPRVLLVEDPGEQDEELTRQGLIDATIAKPITPDVLQPVVERLIEN